MIDKVISKIMSNDFSVSWVDMLPLEVLPDNDPCDTDSIGELINKLSSVTIQMWNNQDLLYKIRFMSAKEFENAYKEDMGGLHSLIRRACDLNVQRANIIDAIDKAILTLKHGYLSQSNR